MGLAGAIALAALAAGCASQTISSEWKDTSFRGSVDSVFVVAIRREEIHRRLWEDAFVAELTARGVTAVQSYRLFPDGAPDTQQVITAVRERHFGGVLVSSRLPNSTSSTYVPGHTETRPVTTPDVFSNSYSTRWTDVKVPSSIETTNIRHYETDLWKTGAGAHMIWTGVCDCPDSVDPNEIGEDIGLVIVPQMERAGVVPARRKK